MFQALADAGVNIQMITTSEIKISTLVDRDSALSALRAVHRAFELERRPADVSRAGAPTLEDAMAGRAASAADEVVSRLQDVVDMEQLTIDDVSLDETQARVTMSR